MAVEAMAIIDEATCVAPTLGVPFLKARSTYLSARAQSARGCIGEMVSIYQQLSIYDERCTHILADGDLLGENPAVQ